MKYIKEDQSINISYLQYQAYKLVLSDPQCLVRDVYF